MSLTDSVSVELIMSDGPVGELGKDLFGMVILGGGKSSLTITAIRASLEYEGPDPQTGRRSKRTLSARSFGKNAVLSPEQEECFHFHLQVPADTVPSKDGGSYVVKVVADIPGVKSPSVMGELHIVAAAASDDGASEDLDSECVMTALESQLIGSSAFDTELSATSWPGLDEREESGHQRTAPLLAVCHACLRVRSDLSEAWIAAASVGKTRTTCFCDDDFAFFGLGGITSPGLCPNCGNSRDVTAVDQNMAQRIARYLDGRS